MAWWLTTHDVLAEEWVLFPSTPYQLRAIGSTGFNAPFWSVVWNSQLSRALVVQNGEFMRTGRAPQTGRSLPVHAFPSVPQITAGHRL